GQAHGVCAGQDARPRGGACGGRSRGDARRLFLHGPQYSVDALALPGRWRVDDAARGVEDLELHPPERVARPLVIGDDGGGRRVRPGVRGGALRPAARTARLLPHGASREERDVLLERLRREGAERCEVVDDPDPAPMRRDDEILLARLEREVPHGDGREVAALELDPRLPRVERDPEPELRPEVEEAGPDRVFLDHVRPAADARRRADDPLPRLPGVARRADPRRHVAEGVPIKCSVRGAVRVRAGLDPRDPARGRQAQDILHEVRPRRAAVTCELEVAVVGPDPDRLRVARALRDRVDRRVHLGGGLVDLEAAGALLLLFYDVIRREVRRDPLPRLPAVLRLEEELCADVELPLLEARDVNRRIPVPAQLLPVAGFRLDVAGGERAPVDPADEAALPFRVDEVRVERVHEDPEAVAVVEVLPPAVRDTARVRRVARPRAVVLQAAVHLVGVLFVHGHVVKLRDWQIVALPPAVRAVVGDPKPAVVAGHD